MNIRTSACYLAGGLYFLLFAAACTCSPSGKIPGGPEQSGTVQQMQAPAAAADTSAEVYDEEMISGDAVEGAYYAEEGAAVESSSSVDGEMMVDDGSSYVESSTGEYSEGEVVEGGSVEEMPAAEGAVEYYSETTVTEGGDAAVEGGFVEGTVDYSETTVTEGGDDEMMMEGPADGQPVIME
ncbi:hypothetical protein [Candidatus Electronema sp. JC]|uniref:hypothetical protein n=1 Tax=Candidatus Electronema sp. JC TaxID=3401570 RepID=UPI003AA85967